MSDMDWKEMGNCRGKPVKLFYPERGCDAATPREICHTCPVRAECLDHALRHESYGIWGGTSEKARERIRRERRIHVSKFPTSPYERRQREAMA